MGRACCTAEASTAVTMKVFMLLAFAAGQIKSQDHGNMDGMTGSGHGGMDGSGMGSGMGGSGSGMGGSGYGMGGAGMGGSGFGPGYGGDWMGGSGDGEWMNWMGGECCPTKKIWGSMYPEKDGIYDLYIDGYMMMGSGMGSG